ncbi:MAG: VWA domain-containing protein [Acidimicrobiia bacterium]|nr:VWA domain-containing protein [Acidimicrobiia bacterium]
MRRSIVAMMAAALLLIPQAGLAQEELPPSAVTIERVEAGTYPDVLVLVTAPTEFLTTDLGPDEWVITEDGVSQDVFQVARVEGDQIEVVLVIDTSGSMAGDGIDGATTAAANFLSRLPEGAQVAVVGFGSTAEVVQEFTPDLEAVGSALDSLVATGETALYDAITTAAGLFSESSDAQRSLIVLTDGADTVSGASETQAALSIRNAESSFFAVELQTGETATEPLAQLALAAGGAKVGSTPEELEAVYDEIANRIVSRYVLRYQSEGSGSTTLGVAVGQEGLVQPATSVVRLPITGTVGDVARTTTTTGSTTTTTAPPPIQGFAAPVPTVGQPGMIWAGLAAVFIGLGLLLLFFLQPETAGVPRGRQSVRPSFRTSRQRAVSGLARGLVSVADRAATRAGSTGLDGALERAGLRLRPGEYAVLTLLVAVVVLSIGISATGSIIIGIVVFAAVGAASFVFLSYLGRRRQRTFEQQLPDVLGMLASTIRTGYAPLQATELVSREVDSPTKEEFGRVVAEARLGRDYIDAMAASAVRMRSQDLTWVVEAMEINRDVGGDIAELLDTVAQTIREREALRRLISALSAEGRLSAWVLIALPFGLAGFLWTTNPGYLQPLVTTTMGIIMIAFAVLSMAVGIWFITKILDLEA